MTQCDEWPATAALRGGFAALAILVLGFGLWSALTPIAGAVVAAGTIDVPRSRQILQHPEGGRVAGILVTEGQRVAAGQLLIRLDGQALRSELALTEARLAQALVDEARLAAESDGLAAIRYPALLADLKPPGLAELKRAAEGQFTARAAGRAAERDQSAARERQIASQIEGLAAQAAATGRQIALLDRDLAAQRKLLDKGLAQASRVGEAERDRARLDGTLAELAATRAAAESRLSEARLESLRLDAARRDSILADLKTAASSAADLSERRRALIDRIAALDLRAPAAGIVFGLRSTSPGAVLQPAEPALFVVPQNQPFVAEIRVEPRDIGDIHPGQPARLRPAAADGRRTTDLVGRVTAVAPDAAADRAGDRPYYRVEIALAPSTEPLLPGMPVDVFLATRDRTPLAYLAGPLLDYFRRAFRDG